MKKQIPIFFTIDDKYAPYVACAITSIIENSSKDYEYKIFIHFFVNTCLQYIFTSDTKCLLNGHSWVSFNKEREITIFSQPTPNTQVHSDKNY